MSEIRKNTTPLDGDLRCSFCGERPADLSRLIEGPDVCICDECIAECNALLNDKTPSSQDEDKESTDPGRVESPPATVFFRLVTEAEVARLITMDDLIDLMEDAVKRFSAGSSTSPGSVIQPLRTIIPVGDEGQLFGVMPAYVRDVPAIGAKLVAVFPGNAANGLPTHVATILLFSPRTGALVGIIDGRYITEARTAAVSAVSANLLARDDAEVMAILGSGVQARSHLEALERIFEFTEIRVWSPTPEHQDTFVEEMTSATKARLVGADSAEEAVRGADVIVLATSSSDPVVESEWVKAGAHVISVGACRPDQREMDPALVRRGRLFVDSRAAALVESGDVVMGMHEGHLNPSHIAGELGELAAGTVEGRRSPREVTIFKSLGLAVEDVMAAELVYRRAVEQGVGSELEL